MAGKFFLLATAVAATEITSFEQEFMHWISAHGRSYGTVEEYKFRFE